MTIYNAAYYVRMLNMQAHPEGGWYKETYRSNENIPQAALPDRFGGNRSFCTGIYFLLQYPQFSAFHRIKSDEMWHFYAGSTLNIHIISTDGNYEVIKLGPDAEQGQSFQAVVKAGSWFASQPVEPGTGRAEDDVFSLVGCTVAPGFDFNDFEMARAGDLIKQHPQHRYMIERYCRAF